MSLYAKRLERGRFVWPSAAAGVVSIAQGHFGCKVGKNMAPNDEWSPPIVP